MTRVAERDWVEWHRPYDNPGSRLHQRLLVVQRMIRRALDATPSGPIRIVSMCAGQGRDVLGVLADHPRRNDVSARLVERDPTNADVARHVVRDLGLDGVEVMAADAGTTDSYAGAVPADLVLACGVFGNITDDDIARTVERLPQLCAEGATVIWTRHRYAPDLTPAIRGWFDRFGFDEVAFEGPDEFLFGVGANRLRSAPAPLQPGVRLFSFV